VAMCSGLAVTVWIAIATGRGLVLDGMDASGTLSH